MCESAAVQLIAGRDDHVMFAPPAASPPFFFPFLSFPLHGAPARLSNEIKTKQNTANNALAPAQWQTEVVRVTQRQCL